MVRRKVVKRLKDKNFSVVFCGDNKNREKPIG
jgi:hypothetical protein